VTIAAQGAKIAIQLASVVVLSRLLAPDDFGLIAMMGVFYAVADMLRDFGISTAALQARSLSQQQASNLFWINTALGVVLGALLIAASPLIAPPPRKSRACPRAATTDGHVPRKMLEDNVAGFYDEPRLIAIAPAMALVLVVNGVQTQFQVRLARNLRFSSLAATDVSAQALAQGVAVLAAAKGAGYWSLVLQALTVAISLLLMRAFAAQWRPGRFRDFAGTRELAVSGGHLGTAQLLSYAASNSDTVFIGASLGATELGFYNRAFQLVNVPVASLLGPLTHVVVPLGTKATSRGVLMDSVLLRAQTVLALPAIGVLSVAATIGPQAVPWILGAQWSRSAEIFVVLSIAASFTVLSNISYWAFLLTLASRELLRYNLMTKSMTVVLVVVAAQHSTLAVAWAYTLALALSWPINLIWLWKTTPLQPGRYLRSGALLLATGAAAWAAGHGISSFVTDAGPLGAPVVAGLTTLAAYFLLISATPHGRRGLAEVWHVARQGLGRST